MRKRLILLLALCAIALGAGQAGAVQYSGPHQIQVKVNFRSQRNDASLGLSIQDIASGYVDSTYKTTQGKGVIVSGATGTSDTTVAVSLLPFIPNPIGATTAANDSVSWFRVSFTPGPDCAATSVIDSLYVLPQVSADGGNTWESVNVLKDVAYADWRQAASILTSATPMLRLANGTATTLFHTAISSRFGADLQGLGTWPMVRFILIHDISASATAAKHQFRCSVTGWSCSVDGNVSN